MKLDFNSRVNYAVQCIKVGATGGRNFDTCFEMWDGSFVVTAIMRRAWKDENFNYKLRSFLSKQSWDEWTKTALEFENLTNKELKLAADEIRAKRQKESERRFNEYAAKNGEKEQF